jgi:hypothetical protein
MSDTRLLFNLDGLELDIINNPSSTSNAMDESVDHSESGSTMVFSDTVANSQFPNTSDQKSDSAISSVAAMSHTSECQSQVPVILRHEIKKFQSKAGARKRDKSILEKKWCKNSRLQAWYYGEMVDLVDMESGSIERRVISDAELLADYKKLLRGSGQDILVDIWNNNARLKEKFAGIQVDMDEKVEQEHRPVIYSNEEQLEHIACFKRILNTRYPYLIKSVWNKNSQLRARFSGHPYEYIDSETNEKVSAVISNVELLNNFKKAIYARYSQPIVDMWNGNPLLQKIFYGTDETMLANFEYAVRNKCMFLAKQVLDNSDNNFHKMVMSASFAQQKQLLFAVLKWGVHPSHSFVNSYCNSFANVDLITSALTHFQKQKQKQKQSKLHKQIINFIEGYKKDHFQQKKHRHQAAHVDSHQESHSTVSSSAVMNNEMVLEAQVPVVTLQEIVKFKSLVDQHYAKSGKIPDEAWTENPGIQAWYSGEQVEILDTVSGLKTSQIISDDVLCADFNKMLRCTEKNIFFSIWNNNARLKEKFAGIRISPDGDMNQKQQIIDSNDDQVAHIAFFKMVLKRKQACVIQFIWNENPRLRARFSGHDFLSLDFETGSIMRMGISNEDLFNNFKIAIASGCRFIVRDMWNNNLRLQNMFCQSNEAMLSNFKYAISYANVFLAQYILNQHGKAFHDSVKGLPVNQQSKLLLAVLNLRNIGFIRFVSDYFDRFGDAAVIDSALSDLMAKRNTRAKNDMIAFIQDYKTKPSRKRNAATALVLPVNHPQDTSQSSQASHAGSQHAMLQRFGMFAQQEAKLPESSSEEPNQKRSRLLNNQESLSSAAAFSPRDDMALIESPHPSLVFNPFMLHAGSLERKTSLDATWSDQSIDHMLLQTESPSSPR